jgi:peptidoglycan hydrolase-like protein with peptidoglycan-binding domain
MTLNSIASGTASIALAAIRNSQQTLTQEIQQCLTALGFQPGAVDGWWGNRTQTAFVAFANRNQLKSDEISPAAAQILLGIQPSNLNRIASGTTTIALVIIRNSQNLTREVQQRLTTIGFQPGAIDGVWGSRTQSAFATFASLNQLKSDEITPKAAQILLGIQPKPDLPAPPPSQPTDLPPSATPLPQPTPRFAAITQAIPAGLRSIASESWFWQMNRIMVDQQITRQIQQGLDAMGHEPGPVDGLWGNQTQAAYADFAKTYGLKADELSPIAALMLLEPAIPQIPVTRPIRRLTPQDFQNVARSMGCEVAAVRAVVDVEAAGSGFLSDGRPKILFEAHWFSEYTSGRFDQSHADISSAFWNRNLYVGGVGEWDRLYRAARLNREAALKSASWGLGQIMGFNHPTAGYRDAESFVREMHESEGKQLAAMFNFVRGNRLDRFLIDRDWAGFARQYNGESFQVNRYDQKLAEAYNYWRNAA